MVAFRPPPLTGLSREREELDDALSRIRDGESAVLVVRGEAGVGKSALLQYTAARANDCRVVQVAGVESELDLPFAALHQLCGPLLGEVETVPAHQEEVLRVAL